MDSITVETSTFTNANNTENNCYPSANPEKQLFVGLYLAVIVLGIPSNIFFLFVSCQHIRQKNELGVYLFNLALSDLLFIACLPVWLQFMLNDQWIHGEAACTVCIFLLFTNFYTSAVLLSCIAVDRYLAVVHPLKFCTFRKRKMAVTVSVTAWIFTAVFNAITVNLDSVYDKENQVCLDVHPLPKMQMRVNIARLIIGFLIPAAVVGFCCWQICLDVKRNRTLGSTERRRVFKLLGSVLLTLYICFGPVHIIMVLKGLVEICPHPNWLLISYKLSILLSTLNCLADPLLYCFMSRVGQASASNALHILRKTFVAFCDVPTCCSRPSCIVMESLGNCVTVTSAACILLDGVFDMFIYLHPVYTFCLIYNSIAATVVTFLHLKSIAVLDDVPQQADDITVPRQRSRGRVSFS